MPIDKQIFLTLLLSVLVSHQAFAAWAAHLVVSPASLGSAPKTGASAAFATQAAELARGVTVQPAAKDRLHITLKGTEETKTVGKNFFLIVSKRRLASDALELSTVLGATDGLISEGGKLKLRKSIPEGFVEVRPLDPTERNGENIIGVELDRETALRSYIVYDHQSVYETGLFPMDGGLCLTYDLPAFVEDMPVAK